MPDFFFLQSWAEEIKQSQPFFWEFYWLYLILYVMNLFKGEDLLWNDHEVKLLDQAVRTMESYVGQFPDVSGNIELIS